MSPQSEPDPIVTDNGSQWTPILLGGEWLYRTPDYCVVYTRDQLQNLFGISEEAES